MKRLKNVVITYTVSKVNGQMTIDGNSDIENFNFNNFNCSVKQFKREVSELLIRRGYKATFERLFKKDLF